jgi:membrane protein implicated in regulation of membrane protease activity
VLASQALNVLHRVSGVPLGVVIVARLWRFRAGFPWVVALAAFVAVLCLLLVAIERVVRRLERREASVRLRETEYACG